MKRDSFFLSAAALLVCALSFTLVSGLRRIVGAHSGSETVLEASSTTSAVLLPASDSGPAASELVGSEAPASDAHSTDMAGASDVAAPVQGIVWGHVRRPTRALGDQVWLTFADASGDQRSVKVDGRGAYSIAGLAPGTWWATTGSSLLGPQEKAIEIPPAHAPIRQDFDLRERPRVDVRLVAPGGRPYRRRRRKSRPRPTISSPLRRASRRASASTRSSAASTTPSASVLSGATGRTA